MKNLSLTSKSLFVFIIVLLTFTIISFSDNSWKIKIKGSNKEVKTNPIIKGTSVFIDIYDLSTLFNIDYEVNLTRKYITFHKIPSKTDNSKIDNSNIEKTNQTLETSTYNSEKNITTNQYLIQQETKQYQINNINKIILDKINSIRTIIISNPINNVPEINNDNYKTYTTDIENVENVIKSHFIEKSFKSIVIDKNFNINSSDLNYVMKSAANYIMEKNIDACIIPILKKYYYYEKDNNTLIPTVEIQINYILLNKNREILFFNVQNISRNIAVLSSGSSKYRKSKLLDLTRMSVDLFIKDYNEYIDILSK